MQLNLRELFVLISCVLLSACSQTIYWQEEVLLSSGQKITVNRTVELISAEVGKRRPTTYEIDAKNPSTGKKVNWEGSFGLGPIMLDFKDSQAFIVAIPMMCDAKIKKFSTEGFPYIFMRSMDGNNWETISPSQFPAEYKNINLSAGYDSYRIKKGVFQSTEDVSKHNNDTEQSSSGFIQVSIPRSPQEWNYKYSKYYKGCS